MSIEPGGDQLTAYFRYLRQQGCERQGLCIECGGGGWHVGECHPRETCGSCDGSGRATAAGIKVLLAARNGHPQTELGISEVQGMRDKLRNVASNFQGLPAAYASQVFDACTMFGTAILPEGWSIERSKVSPRLFVIRGDFNGNVFEVEFEPLGEPTGHCLNGDEI